MHTCNKNKSRVQPVEVQSIEPTVSPQLKHTCSKHSTSISSSPQLNSPSNLHGVSSPSVHVSVPSQHSGLGSSLHPAVHIDLPSQHRGLSPSLPPVHVHVCSPTKHTCRHVPSPHKQFGTPSKTAPVAAIRPQVRPQLNNSSSQTVAFQRTSPQRVAGARCSKHATSPSSSQVHIEEVVLSSSQEIVETPSNVHHPSIQLSPQQKTTSSQVRTTCSPTKRLLSREKRNRRSSRVVQTTTSSTDSDGEYEVSADGV